MKFIKRFSVGFSLVACVAGAPSSFVQAAENYPQRPVTIVVPFVPGGATDVIGRLLATSLGERWNQSVVVENKPGASGAIGTAYVGNAPADGYTLLLGTQTALAVTPNLKEMNYNVETDFTPISLLVTTPLLLISSDSLDAKNATEMVKLLKSNSGKYSYGTSGIGTSQHLTTLLFLNELETEALHVPYKGAGQFLVDLAGGQLDFAFDNIGTALGASKQKNVRALAVTGLERSPLAPEIPTLAESGLPGFEATTWLGLLAPGGMSDPLTERLNKEVVQVLNDPEFKEKLSTHGFTPRAMTSGEFKDYISSETQRFATVIKNNKVVIE